MTNRIQDEEYMEQKIIRITNERGAPIIPQIKICGITSEAEAEYLNESRVDYAGFVFFEKSKRNISLEKAEKIFEYLSPDIKKVAVMVSPDEQMISRFNETGFDIIQIHGEITEQILGLTNKPVWQALNLKSFSKSDGDETTDGSETSNGTGRRWRSLSEKTEGLVLDASNYGSGKTFDWSEASKINEFLKENLEGKKFILAGGLNSGNVSEGIRIFSPDIVDVSSGVEGEKGKDRIKVEEFVKAVRSLDIE